MLLQSWRVHNSAFPDWGVQASRLSFLTLAPLLALTTHGSCWHQAEAVAAAATPQWTELSEAETRDKGSIAYRMGPHMT